MEILHAVAAGIAPPLCAACGRSCRPEAVVCTRCGRRLAAAEPLLAEGPPGLDRAWSSAPHEGVARDLVAALKFRRLLPVAELMADRIQWLAARLTCSSGAIVPVPPAPSRLRRRGFDPAGELAAALAEQARLAAGDAAWRGAAAAARSAGAAPSGSAGHRKSTPPRRRPAASS